MKPQQAKLSSGGEKIRTVIASGGKGSGDWQERDSRKLSGVAVMSTVFFF